MATWSLGIWLIVSLVEELGSNTIFDGKIEGGGRCPFLLLFLFCRAIDDMKTSVEGNDCLSERSSFALEGLTGVALASVPKILTSGCEIDLTNSRARFLILRLKFRA